MGPTTAFGWLIQVPGGNLQARIFTESELLSGFTAHSGKENSKRGSSFALFYVAPQPRNHMGYKRITPSEQAAKRVAGPGA